MYRFARIILNNYRRFGSYKNQVDFTPKFPNVERTIQFIGGTTFLQYFGKPNKEEEQESDLIMTIKRGVLSVQREEFQKAEQLFHVALRMAQTVKNQLAETYIFDLMGNLAYESNQLEKAEKLFISVIQRLMTLENAAEDDIRLLHISTKIAHIAYLQNDLDKAILGFNFVLDKIEKKDYLNDENLYELWGLVKNFLGQVYISLKQHDKAKEALLDAQKIFIKFKEEASEDGMILLNNLSVCHAELKQFEQAEKYLSKAIEIARELKLEDISPYQINLGMLYIKQKMIEKAQVSCRAAWQLAKKLENKDALEGAEKCLDQVKKALS